MDKIKLNSNNGFLEAWHQWRPSRLRMDGNYYIESAQELKGDFKLILNNIDTNKKIEIFFEGLVCAYRSTYETFRINLINRLKQKYGTDFYAKWSFFKVANSEYVKWVTSEADGTLSENEITHFVIMGTESIVEIIAFKEPSIKILE